MEQKVSRGAAAAVALNYFVWGILPLFWILLSHVDSLYILAQRIMWAALISGCWVLATSRRAGGAAVFAGASPALVLSAAAIAVNWGLYIWAVGNGYVSYAALAYFVSPLLSVFLGAAVFGERLSPAQCASIALAAGGAALFGWGQAGAGLLVVFGVAGSFSVYAALKKTVRVKTVPGLFIESAVLAPVALALVCTGVLRPGSELNLRTWLLFVAAGLVTFLPLVVMSHYARRVPLSLLGMLQFISPVAQLALGVTVFGEELSGRQVAALALILLGVTIFLGQARASRHTRRSQV
ncbi:EamA family transporter [Corynebacterium senegalense]|uniref:EamA family transporter n=1 Tax=Corynebacterium senegalense TaxID=2080750 RepID=UPI000E20C54E|nr:EamA family transporter [Corynebacterium senegalense]